MFEISWLGLVNTFKECSLMVDVPASSHVMQPSLIPNEHLTVANPELYNYIYNIGPVVTLNCFLVRLG